MIVCEEALYLLAELQKRIHEYMPDLEAIYKFLHSHPELSMMEVHTSRYIVEQLKRMGITDVHECIGNTGVVAVLQNGDGPVVMMRADMDALPMQESTGVPYASSVTSITRKGDTVPVAHMCGHDMHMTWLLGALRVLQDTKDDWKGTVVAIFQPGEETAEGSQAMLDDGLSGIIPKPDVILGQHVLQYKAGTIGYKAGQILTAGDSLKVTFYGKGGHGGMPHDAIDPVVMACSAVTRLQTLLSREVSPQMQAVITVGEFHAGKAENIIPDEAYFKLNVRTTDETVRHHILDGIRRICQAEALASNAPKEPLFEEISNYPLTVNDKKSTERIVQAFTRYFGDHVFETKALGASEDFSRYGRAWDVPYVYWFIGGTDTTVYEQAVKENTVGQLPGPHSPFWAPALHPTLETGVSAMIVAASSWLITTK